MLNRIYKYSIIISLVFITLTFIKIENKTSNIIKNDLYKTSIIQKENKKQNEYEKENDIIGNIIINKINLNKPLYNKNSNKNNIEENVTILKESIMPDEENSIVFIAAHSGTGPIAFFKDLDKLIENDNVILEYNNIKYEYIVKNSWEVKKNGYINVNKERKNQLILTTCSPNNKDNQLIINCIQKESNQ